MMPGGRRVFVSYSHRDRAWLDRLQVHLRPLERAGLVDRWDDTRINPGEAWQDEIARALASSDVAVLLVSADFLASEFITSQELPTLLETARARGLLILMVLLKPCRLAGTPLADLQAVHPVNLPLQKMSEADQEDIWVQLVDKIQAKFEETSGAGPVTAAAPAPAAGPVSTLPYGANPFFTGRDDALRTLRERLVEHGRAAVTGLGGVGKTQLALAYAHRYSEDYRHILWTRASTPLDLLGGFTEFARLLRLAGAWDADQQRAVDAVRRWLDEHQGWLLVLDNADDPSIGRTYLPRGRGGHVLVTSRNRNVQALGVPQPTPLSEMPAADAVEFLLRRTGRAAGDPREDQAIQDLARELGHLPLALEQAAAYIAANQSRFQDYLRGYRSRRLAVLTAPVAGEYPDSVATTWALNFREVAQVAESADLLHASAFLHADDIPLELIARGAPDLGPTLSAALANVMEDPLLLDEALEPLYRYSLVRRDVATRTYSILPIMQAVLLDGLSPENQSQWAARVVRAVKRAFPAPYTENWPAAERLIAHAMKCAELVAKFRFEFPEAGFLLLDAATYLRRRARYADATALQHQLLELRERTLGPNHTATAETLANLGKLYRQLGRYAEAEPLVTRALAIQEAARGPDHPELARVLTTLAALYQNMGRGAEAVTAARRALKLQTDAPKKSDRGLAKALTNLANILTKQGNLAEAEPLLRQSLALEERAAGADHHDLAASLTMLADVCRSQGQHEEAERLLRRALKLDEDALGTNHPNVAWSLSGLAEVFAATGRADESRAYFARAVALREKALGPDHPLTRAVRERLAAIAT